MCESRKFSRGEWIQLQVDNVLLSWNNKRGSLVPNWIRACISTVVYLDVLSFLSLFSASHSTSTVFTRRLLFFWHVSHNSDEIITLELGILTRKVTYWIYTQFCCAQWYIFKGYNIGRFKRSIFRIFEIIFSWFVVTISPPPPPR